MSAKHSISKSDRECSKLVTSNQRFLYPYWVVFHSFNTTRGFRSWKMTHPDTTVWKGGGNFKGKSYSNRITAVSTLKWKSQFDWVQILQCKLPSDYTRSTHGLHFIGFTTGQFQHIKQPFFSRRLYQRDNFGLIIFTKLTKGATVPTLKHFLTGVSKSDGSFLSVNFM